jgi:hypothetical protein
VVRAVQNKKKLQNKKEKVLMLPFKLGIALPAGNVLLNANAIEMVSENTKIKKL